MKKSRYESAGKQLSCLHCGNNEFESSPPSEAKSIFPYVLLMTMPQESPGVAIVAMIAALALMLIPSTNLLYCCSRCGRTDMFNRKFVKQFVSAAKDEDYVNVDEEKECSSCGLVVDIASRECPGCNQKLE